MNIYLVTEGKSEKKVYQVWIPLINPQLTYVDNIFLMDDNNFSIISGYGYPHIFKIIDGAIQDINQVGNIDRLIIVVDSEDMSLEEKQDEIISYIKSKKCLAEIQILIQHFCLETWALGNKRVGPRKPQNQNLKTYKQFYNVLESDPELLPQYPPENLKRAQFALRYLKLMLKEKHLIYSKGHPKPIMHPTYFREIKKRFEFTGHIKSFQNFLKYFI